MGNYSAPLVLLIKGLCQADPDKRITCKELAEWLSKYEGNIIELQEFTISDLPDKLHRLTVKAQPQPQRPVPPQFYPQPQYQLPGNFISVPVNRP